MQRPTHKNATRSVMLLRVLAVLGSGALCRAYPELWDGCEHPVYPDIYRPHGDVQENHPGVAFQLLRGGRNGEPVAEYIPGEQYTLQVTPHKRSEGIVTANIGHLEGMGSDTSNDWRASCTNELGHNLRATFGKKRSVFYLYWTAPTDDQVPGRHPVRFKATFSENSVGDFVQNHMNVDAEESDEDGPQGGPGGADTSRAGNCVDLGNGKRVCDLLCDELKVTQHDNGKLALQCVTAEG